MQTGSKQALVWLALSCALFAAPLRAEPGLGPAAASASEPEVVVLLHGLGRSQRGMRPMEAPLIAAGYRVENLDYASRRESLDEIVADLSAQIAACCERAPQLHFVTHSLGGIILRAYLAEHEPANLGRVVMLAPPNHGSEYVDVLGFSKLFQLVVGPTALQLGTDAESLANRLPAPDCEFGVIAGTRNRNPITSLVVPGESDGAVSVAGTRLDGMADFVTVPVSHPFLARSKLVGGYVVTFLKGGSFGLAAH